MSQKRPKISVFATSRNGGRFLRETLDSILNQTFEDFEIVLVDGASTDNTLEILEEYKDEPRLRWISEPDNDSNEGFYKALMMTRGEYVMCCSVSDGYLSRNWFQKCVDVLDNDIEVSLVYGTTQIMHEDGSLGNVNFQEWFRKPPPNKMDFLPYWLSTFSFIPELTYCVRGDIYKKCCPNLSDVNWNYLNPPEPLTNKYFETHGCFLRFKYSFITNGYLTFFLPIVASYGRYHSNSRNDTLKKYHKLAAQKYVTDVIKYRKEVLSGKRKHVFRNGKSEIIKAIEPHELTAYKLKALKYRMTRNVHFNHQDKLNFFVWKNKIRGLEGKIKRGLGKIG